MNSDQDSRRSEVSASQGERTTVDITHTVRPDKLRVTTFTYTFDLHLQNAAFTIDHDTVKGVFRLTDALGNTECVGDKPGRYLIVEPDPQTGGMRAVRKLGQPQFIYLCREDREA